MSEPTGSVYLDAPDQSPARANRSARARVVSAAVLGFIGMTSMLLAGVLAGLHYLVADPSPTIAAVGATLDNPVARAEMRRKLSSAITDRMVEPDVSAAAALHGIDVKADADLVANAILDDPTFRLALDGFIIRAHDLMLIDPRGPAADISVVTDAAMAVVDRESPQLAAVIAPDRRILTFDSTSLPDLSVPMRFVDRALLSALVGLLGLPLAALIHPHRHRVLAWVGRLWLIAGVATAAATVGLPYLGGRISGWSTVEVALRAALFRFLVPSVAIAMAGLAFMTTATVLKHREQTRISREGAGVALGIGLISGPASTHSITNLTTRGMAEVGRPLTGT